MKITFILFCSFILIGACDKQESTSKGEPAVKAPKVKIEPKKTVEKPEKPKAENAMAEVHAALRNNKKLSAIRAYRKVHKLPLNVVKLAVEIEQSALGLNSLNDVQSLVWQGKEAEATMLLRKIFPTLTGLTAPMKLKSMKERVGPATEKNLALHIKNGKMREAILITHYLHPETKIPEMYESYLKKMSKKP